MNINQACPSSLAGLGQGGQARAGNQDISYDHLFVDTQEGFLYACLIKKRLLIQFNSKVLIVESL